MVQQPFSTPHNTGSAIPARANTSSGMLSPVRSLAGSPSFGSSGRRSPMFGATGRASTAYDESREKGLSMSQSIALSACNCSAAFKSNAPRLTPVRTYAGADPRATMARDPLTKLKHPFQYQSPQVYNTRIGRSGRQMYSGIDAFRYGVEVKEPLRASSPFTSALPRLPATRPLEPIRRVTYGAELNSRAFTYLPFHQPR